MQLSVTSAPIHSDKKRVFISRLEFDFGIKALALRQAKAKTQW